MVNDYFDAKLGRDTGTERPLVTGNLSFKVVRRYLTYLYAAALVMCTLLPGAPARLSVVLSLMLTFWYTNHLKPLTWVKNAVCAFLIAFAPLASGSAALYLVSSSEKGVGGLIGRLGVPLGPIWRMFGMLFFGILGREMTMDCNDVENDRDVGVLTIPVVHGTTFTSKVAFGCAMATAGLALLGPIRDSLVGQVGMASWRRRLALAVLGSLIQLFGAWRVWKTEGRDPDIVHDTVERGTSTILVFLASYL